MFTYVIEFLEGNNILHEYQFNFQKNHTTIHAIITLVERATKALDASNYVVGVFLDLKKAFDTIDHTILLRKLESYGIKGNILNWFISYLSYRSQYVDYNSKHIQKENIYITEYPRDPYMAPYYIYCMLMTFQDHLIYYFQYYLLMIQRQL